ncbi:MAG: type I restriction endonuclease subunit R [Cyanobacteria bacterium P01_G01_bin.54]
MVKAIPSRDLSLAELQEQFDLQRADQPDFFPEWQTSGAIAFGSAQSAIASATEKQQLQRIQQNYLNLASRKVFSEEAVKMVVLSPLLDLAGFYQAPFGIQTEEPIELKAEEGNVVVKGNIDVLVVLRQFWVLVVESKSTQFDVLTALPQALSYMLTSPNPERPVYGLLVNGREFVFVKVSRQPQCIYARSYALSVERDDDLQHVLDILKWIRQTLSQSSQQPYQ